MVVMVVVMVVVIGMGMGKMMVRTNNTVMDGDDNGQWMLDPNTQRVTPLSPHAAGDMLEPGLRFSQSFQL